MTYPTPDEIRAAAEAIERDGTSAEITFNLSVIALKDPHLCDVVNRLANISGASGALIASAIVTGLNYGLRIHEQRTRKAGA